MPNSLSTNYFIRKQKNVFVLNKKWVLNYCSTTFFFATVEFFIMISLWFSSELLTSKKSRLSSMFQLSTKNEVKQQKPSFSTNQEQESEICPFAPNRDEFDTAICKPEYCKINCRYIFFIWLRCCLTIFDLITKQP